ncbi:prolipoprotein diacylglyceryl transferase family protein [Candidatus Amarobacter glycogenicus]|uniref:prolipoprotein diacylglyceryl transferase n=1 Tax=Candidatus Amarobacter glycogenicus TaxID=3140699 RepID=UPI002A0D71B7|nr:prolipoprotein diacylglyceryl transferase [Dehalococcoidia bacterium]
MLRTILDCRCQPAAQASAGAGRPLRRYGWPHAWRRRGLDGDHLWNLGFVSAIAALVGGRVAYVLQFWPAYQQDPLAIFSVRPGTLAWTPGLLIGLLAGLLYVRRLHLPLTTVLDALAPGALLGLAILSLADFLAGDAYGTPTTLPWAVELWGARRHPVQLYQLGAQLAALFLVLRRPATWPGQPCVFGENAGLTSSSMRSAVCYSTPSAAIA